MATRRRENVQLNVRSRYARDRAAELSRQTGLTTTQVVEDALRSYVPPSLTEPMPGLERRGHILVLASRGGPPITMEDTDRAIEAARLREE
jgi:hypothetical protein